MSEVGKRQEEALVIPGLAQEIPQRLREIPSGFPDGQKDRLVGVLLETNANRLFLFDKIAEGLKKGHHFGVIYSDVDWLKHLNDTFSRNLGDRAIIHSVCDISEIINGVFQKEEGFEVVIFRSDHAADESWFFILGLSEDNLKLMDKLQSKVATQPAIFFPGAKARGISYSAGVAHSGERQHIEFVAETRKYLENGMVLRPYDLVKQLRNEAVSKAVQIKSERLLMIREKISGEETTEEFIEAAVREFGGMRIGEEVLRSILEEVAQRTREEK